MTDETDQTTTDTPPTRGFAAMDADKRRFAGRKGGINAQRRGTANKFTSETAADAGRKSQASPNARRWTPEEARAAGRLGGRPRKNP